jgi:hypothetical protein
MLQLLLGHLRRAERFEPYCHLEAQGLFQPLPPRLVPPSEDVPTNLRGKRLGLCFARKAGDRVVGLPTFGGLEDLKRHADSVALDHAPASRFTELFCHRLLPYLYSCM